MNLGQRCSYSLLLMFVLGATAAPRAAAQGNPFANPSFENGLSGWHTDGDVSVVPGGQSGEWCARLLSPRCEGPSACEASCWQEAGIESGPHGTTYTVRFWADATPAGAGSFVHAWLWGMCGDISTAGVDISGPWAQYSMTVFVPPCTYPVWGYLNLHFECLAGTERDSLALLIDDIVVTAVPGIPCCYAGPSCSMAPDAAACRAGGGEPVQDCADCLPGACCFGDLCDGTYPRPQCLALGGAWIGGSCGAEYACYNQGCSLITVAHPEASTDTTTVWEIRYRVPPIRDCCHVTESELCFDINPCPLFDPDPPRTECLNMPGEWTKAHMCFPIDDSGGSLMVTVRNGVYYWLEVPSLTWTCSACSDGSPDGRCRGGLGMALPPDWLPVPTLRTTWGEIKARYR